MPRIVAVSTYAFDGYPLETALEELARLGILYVEPCGMDGVFEQLTDADFCDRRAAEVAARMATLGLKSVALSAHMDLTRSDAADRFARRLAFAKVIGARIVNTTAGPPGNADGFRRSLPRLAARAADLGLVIGLENHGDLLHRSPEILRLIESVADPVVRVNYDTGNAWYYAKGQVDPAAELRDLAPVLAHVHLKAPALDSGMMRWVALGDGLLDLPAIGRVLSGRVPDVPVAIELALRQRSRDFEPRWRMPAVPPLEDIRTAIRRSLDAAGGMLGEDVPGSRR